MYHNRVARACKQAEAWGPCTVTVLGVFVINAEYNFNTLAWNLLPNKQHLDIKKHFARNTELLVRLLKGIRGKLLQYIVTFKYWWHRSN
jgi:hypothetical protein